MSGDHAFTNDEKEWCREAGAEATRFEAGTSIDDQISITRGVLEERSQEFVNNFGPQLVACKQKRDRFFDLMQELMDVEWTQPAGSWFNTYTFPWILYKDLPTVQYSPIASGGTMDWWGSWSSYSSLDGDFVAEVPVPSTARGGGTSGNMRGTFGEFWMAYNYQMLTSNSFGDLLGLDDPAILDAAASSGDAPGATGDPTALSPREAAAKTVYEQVSAQAQDWFDDWYGRYKNIADNDPGDSNSGQTHQLFDQLMVDSDDDWRIEDRFQVWRQNWWYRDNRQGSWYDSEGNYQNGNSFLTHAWNWDDIEENTLEQFPDWMNQPITNIENVGNVTIPWLYASALYAGQYAGPDYDPSDTDTHEYSTDRLQYVTVGMAFQWAHIRSGHGARSAETGDGAVPDASGWWAARQEAFQLLRNACLQGSDLCAPGDIPAFTAKWSAAKSAYAEMVEAFKALRDLSAGVWCAQEQSLDLMEDRIEALELAGDPASLAQAARFRREMEALEEGNPATLTGDYQRRVLYREQCFLLTVCDKLASYKCSRIERPAHQALRVGASEQAIGASIANRMDWRPKKLPYQDRPSDGTNIDQAYLDGYEEDTNASIIIDGDPYAFVNKLTQSPNQSKLYDMSEADISSLVPTMRLFKVSTEGDDISQTEFHFDSYATETEVASLRNYNKRSFGIGLQSMNIKYEGSNFFAVRKSIKAELKIFASSFLDLIKQRRSSSGRRYRYVDLALKTGGSEGRRGTDDECSRTVEEENIDRSMLNFRLKALIGWAAPNGNTSHFTPGVKDAIYDSYVSINLTPTIHNFDVDDFGRVVLTIQYAAYVEDFYDQKEFSIFTDADTILSEALRRITYEYWSDRCDSEQMDNIKNSYQQLKDDETRSKINSLIDTLIRKRQMYNISMGTDEIEQWFAAGPFSDTAPTIPTPTNDSFPNSLAGDIGEALRRYTSSDDARDNMGSVAQALVNTNPNNERITYFYVSDLIDNIMSDLSVSLDYLKSDLEDLDSFPEYANDPYNYKLDDTCAIQNKIEDIEEFQKNYRSFRCILGPIELSQLDQSGRTRFVNIGDLPISVKFFIEFLTERLASKEETSYSFNRFLNDFLNKLVRTFLNDDTCWNFSVAQRSVVNQCSISSYKRQIGSGTSARMVDEPSGFLIQDLGRWGTTKEAENNTSAALSAVIGASGPIRTKFYDGRVHISDVRNSRYQPLLKVSGNDRTPDGGQTSGRVREELNYMIYYIARSQPTDMMQGNKTYDESHGIFHYLLGRDKGIIKNIK